MRYLILSDIHSNLEALESCLEMAKGKYDQALCLGDLVGYGPDPNPVIERVREVAQVIIRGNHDKACANITDAHDFNPLAQMAARWTREQLTPEHLSFLRDLPHGPITLDGFQIVHGSPADEDEYIVSSLRAIAVLRNLSIQVVLFGHTHLQGGYQMTFTGRFRVIQDFGFEDGCELELPLQDGTRYLLNPGSIGQPRDGDWRAAFSILDEENRQVDYYRAPYDVVRTQQKMEEAGLPEPLIRRLSFGR